MKTIFSLLMISFSSLLAPASALAFNVSGQIIKDFNGVRIYLNDRKAWIRLQPGNREVEELLLRLETSDALQGSGTLQSNTLMTLEDVDFVGLHRLLGTWRSPSARFTFHSFDEVGLSSDLPRWSVQGRFRYAVSPSQGNNWKFYLSDDNEVQLASLQLIRDDLAHLTLFNSDFSPSTVLNLIKINSPYDVRFQSALSGQP